MLVRATRSEQVRAVLQGGTERRVLRLAVVPRRDAPAIVVAPGRGGGPAYAGPGDADYVCGACGAVLCGGVAPGQFHALAFACHCGAVNRVA